MEMGCAKGPGGKENLCSWNQNDPLLAAGQSAVEMWFESDSNLKGLFCGLVLECHLQTNQDYMLVL